MKNNNVEKILKLKRKQFVLYSIIFLVAVFAPLFFSHTLWVKLLPFAAIVVYIIVIGRTSQLKYLIDDECNPQLYYYAYLGLNKKEPDIASKQRVAELIGDYENAIEIAYSRLNLCKNDNQRLSVIIDIMRISFDAGDFELTKKAYNSMLALNINEKVKAKYEEFFKFYICFIDGDYEKAKKIFDSNHANFKDKRVKNILKYKLCYYEGLLYNALGEKEKAQASLQCVIEGCPYLHIAVLSQKILSGNFTSGDISLAACAEKGAAIIPKKEKTDYRKIISFILSLVVMAVSLLVVAGDADISADTMDMAISNYCAESEMSDSVNMLLDIRADEKHVVCVYETPDCKLSLAYLSVAGDGTYSCNITSINNMLDSEGVDYLQVSGKSKRLDYTFISDSANAPDGYKCEKINDKTCFCYKFEQTKYHFLNSSGMVNINIE